MTCCSASRRWASFGPAIHLPIFDYGRNAASIEARAPNTTPPSLLYDRTLTDALRDVADAYPQAAAWKSK